MQALTLSTEFRCGELVLYYPPLLYLKLWCLKLGSLPVDPPTPWQSYRVKTVHLDIGLWQMPNVFLPDFVMSAAILPEELLRK